MNVRHNLPQPPNRHAFTLVELVIALLFMAALAAVALPRWSGFLHQRRIAAAANRIAADIQRAQSAAYATSSPKSIVFDTVANQYTISGLPSLNSANGANVVQFAEEPFRCQLTSVFGQTGTKTLDFNGYGETVTGGNIVVSLGGQQRTVVVDAATGKAVVQ